MERLIVKNFGPLKDIDIELNKINLFIGENGSGKSVLAKLITIVTDINNLDEEKYFFKKLNEYTIDFISNQSIIKFYTNEDLIITIESKKVIFNRFNKKLMKIDDKLKKSRKNFNAKLINLDQLIDESVIISQDYEKLTSKYIPAERNLISLFNKSLSTLILEEVPLPKFLLRFSSEFEKAGNKIRELEFLNVKYLNGDGLDRHKVYFNKDSYLPLEQSSSGIQSALPLYLTVKYFASKHSSIIIEEPEQNLFPKAQKETIQYIIEHISNDNNLFMMTHSPYVLSTLNILMMAYRAGNLNEPSKAEVTERFNEKQWINPNEFSAYYLENGLARDIKGRTGLISDNEIDEISDDIQSDFEELLSIYREHKNDK
ncbi:MAG: hypothetical protein KU29_10235 [Sulfurovum sp. FS06-10]|jgi:predicted ATPase|nr:MAG: hypothetical protein KU29_10235 [Sulfurovum sp. FS06-10]